jgi:hypothetical protein
MSRSGYSDDCDGWALIRWRGAVNSALKGRRGQAFLKELAAAMDSMPEKRLIANYLQADGKFCALGIVGHRRGMDLTKIDTHDSEQLSREFGIAEAMAQEIMYMNDEFPWHPDSKDYDALRWQQVRKWIDDKLSATDAVASGQA